MNEEQEPLPTEEKQWAMQKVYFITDKARAITRPLVHSSKIVDGKRCVCITQHPLLARGTAIRKACLLGYYHFDGFQAEFNLSMGKGDVSGLAHAAELLSLILSVRSSQQRFGKTNYTTA